ncbi:TRAP transporter large permease [Natronolimnobius sp. AArcel1]|uniref:TRAP transporter large permease n=1 Tax=Natronolimnobius sp. AArcel1 TaxID=1679093 RepID=UPI0013ED5345|nr:TRAP transporter large permease [Natronolimnobius sp. AArcel1]NGM67961.1 TRAP transporter large permease [Natronolimnobius sp. AArcel1]
MELALIALLFLGTLLVLYAFGVPVAVAMGATVLTVMVSPFGPDLNPSLLSNQLLFGLNSFTMLAIPFYLVLGRLMNRSGMTEDIFDFANAVVGHIRGGIGYVNVTASMIFSGMSGLALADAAGLGRIEYSAMREYDYDKDVALGITGSSAIIGPIIPPSVPIIIYGVLAEESISDLFLAGIVPGLLIGAVLLGMVGIVAVRRGYGGTGTFEIMNVLRTFSGAFAALVIPVLIVGGILSGLFTATEAGAITVVYVLIVGTVWGDLTTTAVLEEIRDATVETFALTFIIAVAAAYGLVALELRLPMLMADAITGVTENPTMVLLLLVLLFLLVGTFMETIAAISILVPVLMPVIDMVGIDPIHFGIVMILTLMIGLLTPPLGVILFVLEKVTDATFEEVMYAVIPWYIPLFLVLILVIFVPELATYIPYEYGQ